MEQVPKSPYWFPAGDKNDLIVTYTSPQTLLGQYFGKHGKEEEKKVPVDLAAGIRSKWTTAQNPSGKITFH